MTVATKLNQNSTNYHSTSFKYGSTKEDPRMKKEKKVVIVGSGDMGRALLTCFTRAGYHVTVASRNPLKTKEQIQSLGGVAMDVETALRDAKVVILAIPTESISSLPIELFNRKIVIDISNQVKILKSGQDSLAAELQEQLPHSSVVKAFNTLSAYAIQNNVFQGNKEVPVCSDEEEAKQLVMAMIHDLGYHPIDSGSLLNAGGIERLPLVFFPLWKFPVILGTIIFTLSFLILLFRRQLCSNFNNDNWDWTSFSDILLVNTHNAFALTAIVLLSCCYFPGVVAAYIQLQRGTKYSRFPSWLDKWLKCRKQLGVFTFILAITHAVMAIAQLSQGGYGGDWTHYNYIATGCFSLALMGILAVTSIPSVAGTLSWREFSFVQSKLGWWCLFFALWHFIFKKWGKFFHDNQMCYVIPEPSQIFIWFPLITMVMKIPLLLPFINSHLRKIRRGHERRSVSNLTYHVV